jgi:hypothetical protein
VSIVTVAGAVRGLLGSGASTASRKSDSFSLDNIKGTITKRNGISRTSHFVVTITTPPWAGGQGASILADIPFLCDSAAMPGVTFTTSEIRRLGYGPIERRPDVPMYTELPLTFISTGDGEVIKFFHRWMQNVVNIGTVDKAPGGTSYKGAFTYEAFYPDHYRTTINIYHYNEVGEQLMVYTFNEAYPVGMGEVPLSWTSTDEFVRLPVQFAYTNWHSDTFEIGQVDSPRNSSMSILQKLTSIGSAVATLQNIKKPTSVMDAFNQINNIKTVGNIVGGLL